MNDDEYLVSNTKTNLECTFVLFKGQSGFLAPNIYLKISNSLETKKHTHLQPLTPSLSGAVVGSRSV